MSTTQTRWHCEECGGHVMRNHTEQWGHDIEHGYCTGLCFVDE